MRNAFLLGRTVHLLRAVHHVAWKNVDLAMSRKSLRNYQNFYEFNSKYQRFLRVKTTFTGHRSLQGHPTALNWDNLCSVSVTSGSTPKRGRHLPFRFVRS